MKNTARIFFTIFFLFSIAAAVWLVPPQFISHLGGSLISLSSTDDISVPQQEPEGDKLVLGGSYILEEGETLNGSLLVFGGTAQVSEGSKIARDAVIMGGTLTIDGEVGGEIIAIGGFVSLGSAAHVSGDINTLSAQLDKADGAVIDGKVNNVTAGPYSLIVPKELHLPQFDNPSVSIPRNLQVNPAWGALMILIRSLVWAALAVLVALFLPKSLDRVASAAVHSSLAAGGLGCLTVLIVPLLLVLIALTICGIPISMIGFLLMVIAWGFGVIALGAETGKRLAGLLKSDWALPVAAAVGVFILTLVASGIGLLVPCIGWMASALIGVVGLGAALLTRFGTQTYALEKTGEFSDTELIPSPTSSFEAPLEEKTPPPGSDEESG